MSIIKEEIPNTTARHILLSAADGVEFACGKDDQTSGIVHFQLGRTFAALGDIDQGLVHLDKGLSSFETNLSEKNYFALDAAAELITALLRTQGRVVEAYELARRVSTTSTNKLGAKHMLATKHVVDLGYAEIGRGHLNKAKDTLLRTVELLGSGEDSLEQPEMQRALGNLMSVYNSQSRYEDSVRIGRRLLAARERVLGPTAWPTLMTMAKLGEALSHLGNISVADEAREVLREARRWLAVLEEIDDPGSASYAEISDMGTASLFDLNNRLGGGGKEKESDGEDTNTTELQRAQERVAKMDLTEGALVRDGSVLRSPIGQAQWGHPWNSGDQGTNQPGPGDPCVGATGPWPRGQEIRGLGQSI